MIRVGLTGGMGSGKSTFMEVWKSLGAEVLNADDFAKDLMVSDPIIINRLKNTFGEETFLEDGSLNKDHLIEQAFKNGRVEELNEVVHPQLRFRTKEYADRLEQEEETEVFLYEAAVLLNEGRPDGFDVIILLTSDKNNRVNRVAKRDQVTSESVIQRMQSQPDFEKITHLADIVISNDKTIEDLKSEARKLYHSVLQDFS